MSITLERFLKRAYTRDSRGRFSGSGGGGGAAPSSGAASNADNGAETIRSIGGLKINSRASAGRTGLTFASVDVPLSTKGFQSLVARIEAKHGKPTLSHGGRRVWHLGQSSRLTVTRYRDKSVSVIHENSPNAGRDARYR